jgi:hypothetical protein
MTKMPYTLELARDLEDLGLMVQGEEMRRLHAAVEALTKEKAQAYALGRSHGLYAARDALNDKFGL